MRAVIGRRLRAARSTRFPGRCRHRRSRTLPLPKEHDRMDQIRDAILSGDRTAGDVCRDRRSPTTYRAATVHKDEVEMFEGHAHPREGPAQLAARRRGRRARAGPRRGARRGDGQRDQLQHRLDLDLRAGLDLRLPRALRPHLASSPSATTCPTTWSAPTSPASCCAPVPASPSGSPAPRSSPTASRVELEDADGHNDTMLDPQQRIWGFETNFGGLAELAHRQVQPADAQAGPPDVGGGGLPRPGELHGLPPAHLAATARA